jgi:pimeloyl-ACP methyl ester carboxylesterase
VGEGWFVRAGVRLHYLDWHRDGEEPAILLLHGLSSNGRIWERVAAHLRRRAVALDQRCHGRSDRPPDGYGSAELAEDAAQLIRHLGLERPLVVGHSWGAAIALQLAGTRPDLASGVVLVDGPLAAMSAEMTWEEMAQRMQPPLPTYRDLDQAVSAVRDALGEAWGVDLVPFVEAGLVRSPGGWAPTLTATVREQILRELYRFRPEELLPKVEGPILVAAAGRLWPGAPQALLDWRRRSVDAVQELRPDARVRHYDSSHDIPLIRPEELAADLERTALAAGFWSVARTAAALAAASPDWNRPVHGGEGGWDARELLAHLSSTQAALPAVVSATGGGGGGEPFDPDRWNAGQVRRRRDRSPDQLIEEMREGSRQLQAALTDADLERPTAIGPHAGQPLRAALGRMLQHQRAHLAELEGAP